MKVAIIAGGETRINAPFDDSSIEKWCLNDFHSFVPYKKCNRWFEIHNIEVLKRTVCRFENLTYLDGLKKLDIPIYMQDVFPELKTSIKYPLEEISNIYRRYFHNTICYMLALAIYEGAEEISLYGVDMKKAEYSDIELFKCLMYWIGVAEGKGIKINIPVESRLYMDNFAYGWD